MYTILAKDIAVGYDFSFDGLEWSRVNSIVIDDRWQTLQVLVNGADSFELSEKVLVRSGSRGINLINVIDY